MTQQQIKNYKSKIENYKSTFPRWEGSKAQEELIEALKLKLYPMNTPQEFYKMRASFQEFPLDVFRKHIHQQLKKEKNAKTWVEKKRICSQQPIGLQIAPTSNM